MSYTRTFDIRLGPMMTGQTLTAQLIDAAGEETGDPITDGFVEVGGGFYQFATEFDDEAQGSVKFLIGAAVVDVQAINPWGRAGLPTPPASAEGGIGLASTVIADARIVVGDTTVNNYKANDATMLRWVDQGVGKVAQRRPDALCLSDMTSGPHAKLTSVGDTIYLAEALRPALVWFVVWQWREADLRRGSGAAQEASLALAQEAQNNHLMALA